MKLQYFYPPFGYDEAGIFTTGKDLFDDLWNEWISLRLLALTKGTPIAGLDYQDMFQCLPAKNSRNSWISGTISLTVTGSASEDAL